MQDSLEVVSLAGIFAVEKLKEAAHEVMGDVLHDHILAQVHSEDEFEQELVDELQVWPSLLQMRLILVRVHISRLLVVYVEESWRQKLV